MQCRSGIRRALAIAAILGLAGSSHFARAQSAAFRSIDGSVINAATSRPLGGARVELATADGEPHFARTDDRGRFRLRVPGSAPYVLRARKAGFAITDFEANSRLERPTIRMARGAVVQGTVFDTSGMPLEGIDVHVVRAGTPGERGLAVSGVTDDQGAFRLSGLGQGQYDVHVSDHAGNFGYAPSDLPPPGSMADVQIALAPGEERSVLLTHQPSDRPSSSGGPVVCFQDNKCERVCFYAGGCNAKSVLRGRVTDAVGRPIAGAYVSAARVQPGDAPAADGASGASYTDRGGRFEIQYLANGSFSVFAFQPGYLQSGALAARRRATVAVRDDTVTDGVELSLTRGGSLEGRVVDRRGEPIEGLAVNIWKAAIRAGRHTLGPAAWVWTAVTDDRGNYRLSGIEPGSYYISAADSRAYVNPASIEAPHSYFPGVALPRDASPISIGAAAVPVRVADFIFAPAEAGTIRGRVFDASGRPDSEADVIVHAYGAGSQIKPPYRRARADVNGTFVVPHVPPGDYAVTDAWGRAPFQRVTVRPGREAVMTLREVPAAAVHGQVTFDGDATGRRFWYALASYPANPDTASGTQAYDELGGFTLEDDGTFRISRLLGELRLTSLDLTLPAGWWLKSAIVDGVDVSETPFRFRSGATYSGARIVLSQTAATVSGRVRTPNGDPATQGSALIVPTDSRKWYPGSRYVRAATLAGETFSLTGLPPGDYWVAAIPGEFTTRWLAISVSEPGGEAFLRRATRGARKVTLGPGENATVDLVLRTTR